MSFGISSKELEKFQNRIIITERVRFKNLKPKTKSKTQAQTQAQDQTQAQVQVQAQTQAKA